MEHVDVLIVGAGLSGVGAAVHLQKAMPGKSFVIVETRERVGGTWDLFRYPGVRSDSDMFTFGYEFKPWTGERVFAAGDDIQKYIEDAARENGVFENIRFGNKVISADFSHNTGQWTVELADVASGARSSLTCSFLFANTGYYRYDEGYTPEFAGIENFAGTVIHPQHWPEELDYTGKKVVVIGSGATAVTLLPNLAKTAGHVTMLQRSPTYMGVLPSKDPFANRLRKVLPPKRAYSVVRWRNVMLSMFMYQMCRRRPETMKKALSKFVAKQLPAGYDMANFTPKYNPWDQRLCLVPDADMFRAIRKGTASVVTDQISGFTSNGITLESGKKLDADIIVTATGLNLLALGGIALSVDGVAVEYAERVAYRGLMLSGVPNFALTIGYVNASWTLRADLVAKYICRLLAHMDRYRFGIVTPLAPHGVSPQELRPLLDLQAGYVQRAVSDWPKQGPSGPWRVHQNYVQDVRSLGRGSVASGVEFSRVPVPEPAATN